ncbi:MAG: glycosyltransferase family 2 protein [Pseudomonadota bacterium]
MPVAPILVLIVNYRTAGLTLQAVEAILPEVRARGDAEICIVDNGSGDGSAEQLAQGITKLGADGCCRLIALPDNQGFAAGNNAGLCAYRERAGGAGRPRLIWLLNPDTVAHPNTLTALVDFMDSHPDAGLAGGRCLRPDGSIRHSAFRFHSPLSELLCELDFGPLRKRLGRFDVALPLSDEPYRAEWLSGSNLMIRGAVFERIGLFDSGYFLYFEETDFCARAADAGFEAWHVPDSVIVHLGGQATGFTEACPKRRPRYWFASRARFFLRRHGVAATHLANLLWLVAHPLGRLIAAVRGRPRHDPPRLWLDFLMHYYGPGGLMYRPSKVAA